MESVDKVLEEVKKLLRVVNNVGIAMFDKLIRKVSAGYSGWDDSEWMNPDKKFEWGNWYTRFSDHFVKAQKSRFVNKEDIIDLINFLMFRYEYLESGGFPYTAPELWLGITTLELTVMPWDTSGAVSCSACGEPKSRGISIRIDRGSKVTYLRICEYCFETNFPLKATIDIATGDLEMESS